MEQINRSIKLFRELQKISKEDLGEKLGVPVCIVDLIENPENPDKQLIEMLAGLFKVSPEQFMSGELPKPKEPPPPPKPKIDPVFSMAKFPKIRAFLLSDKLCKNAERSKSLFINAQISSAEKNLIMYFLTNALFYFCNENTSVFNFDDYLHKLHKPLLEKYQNEIKAMNISAEEKKEKLDQAVSNIFFCDTMANIAVKIFTPFTQELEDKLKNNIIDFEEEFDFPYTWETDETQAKIIIRGADKQVRDMITLLDVKVRK